MLEHFIETGNFIRKLSARVFAAIDIGADIADLAKDVDKSVTGKYSLLCPTTMELNHFVNNCSPGISYKLGSDDLLSYCISVAGKIGDGKYAHAKAAFTKSNTPAHDKLIAATAEACKAAMKEVGVDVPLSDLRLTTSEILYSAGFHTITNVCGHELYNSAKIVPNSLVIPEVLRSGYDLINGRMKENEVYFIDVYGTNTSQDVEAVPFNFASIYHALDRKDVPHRKSTAEALSVIRKEYGDELFSLWDFREKFEKKAKIKMNKSILEDLNKKGYIYPVTCAMINEEVKGTQNVVARFGHSVHIGDKKNTVIC